LDKFLGMIKAFKGYWLDHDRFALDQD